MFINRTDLLRTNPPQLNYGITVFDADHDDHFEFFVAGFGFHNQLFKWDGRHYSDVAPATLADPQRRAIGVAAGDLDGDGYEELYILNTDTFAGRKAFADRLFDYADEWVDLFELPRHQSVLNLTAGRSVAVVDRMGTGFYGIIVANYGGAMRLYELDEDGQLVDVAPDVGLSKVTGGRGLVALPLLSDYQADIFAGNENGANFFFKAQGDGTYADIAEELGLHDPYEHARGIAPVDVGDGVLGLVYGNWDGTHRLFIPSSDGKWDDIAPSAMAQPSKVRTVIAADFDNDGYQEIFFNNIGEPNRLFALRDGDWVGLSPGDAHEAQGLGTGAAIADLDGDGRLELLIAHGESGYQPLSLYHTPANDNNYLRVRPLTAHGAPARGAVVTITAGGRTQRRAIDAGSGYLCQMEPIAHFGLGAVDHVDRVQVRWVDGTTIDYEDAIAINQVLRVPFP
jgi:hypothetical protein